MAEFSSICKRNPLAGLNEKTFVDFYRTPHTEKLHVVERYKLITPDF